MVTSPDWKVLPQYRNKRVRSVAQFLLVDDQPNRGVPRSNIRYALEVAPSTVDAIRDQVTIASLGRLTRTLDRLQRRYGSRRRMPSG